MAHDSVGGGFVSSYRAGRGLPGTVLGSDPARWEEMLSANYLAVLRQLRACAERFVALAKGDGGRQARDIVVLGSTVGRQVSAANPVYGSTKFALHSLVEALRQEVCGYGVRVSLIEPELEAKRLEIMKEMLPAARRFAVLSDRDVAAVRREMEDRFKPLKSVAAQ